MLESIKKEEYGGGYNAAVMEQWKMCVEQANSNTERRNNSNALFIPINTGFFAVITFTGDSKSFLLSVVGILRLNMIRSYQQLSFPNHIAEKSKNQRCFCKWVHL